MNALMMHRDVHVLCHQTMVAPSMASEDKNKFSYRYMMNKSLFKGCEVDVETMKQLEEMEANTDKALKLVENIVLYGTFVDLCRKLEEDVMMRMVRNNLCDKIDR